MDSCSDMAERGASSDFRIDTDGEQMDRVQEETMGQGMRTGVTVNYRRCEPGAPESSRLNSFHPSSSGNFQCTTMRLLVKPSTSDS